MMIRTLCLPIICFIMFNLSYSQKNNHIDVAFFDKDKKVTGVKYYLLKENKAYLIKLENSKLSIDYDEVNNKELKLLAKYNNKNITFFIKPKDVYYLKISREPFSFRNFCRKRYKINQGFDYVEIVKQSKMVYQFIE